MPDVGADVRVTLRSEPGSERAVHQFEGEVADTRQSAATRSTVISIRLPFGAGNFVSVKEHEAEFEVLHDE